MRNKRLFFILLFILATYYTLHATSVANAQTVPLQSLKVTPIINDLKLTPGKTMTFDLTIQNLSKNPIGIHADISGYDQIGEKPLYEQKPSAIINWTRLSRQDLLLPPHSSQSITVTITPPAHLPPSGYYETIFLTPIVNQEFIPGSPIILSRVGTLILATTGNPNYDDMAKKVSVSNISPSYTIVNAFPKTVSFSVANNYFTHVDAKPFLTITPLFGKPQTVLLPDKHVLPGSERIWQYQPSTHFSNVFYQIHLAVSVGNGKQVIADTWFIALPYIFILAIIIIVIFFFATVRRNRIKKFFTVLLRG